MARGGYRPGAGRKKGSKAKGGPAKPKKPGIPADIQAEAEAAEMEPLDYMKKVMRDENADPERRDRMAVAAAPYCHSRKGEGAGKKDEQGARARAAGAGKFAAGKAPLKVVK